MIFAAILAIVARSGEVDPASVCAELASQLNDAGGMNYVFSLPQLCPAATNIREYARAVYSASLDRRVRRAIANAIETKTGEDLLHELQDQLYRLHSRASSGCDMDTVWQEFSQSLREPLQPGCEYPWPRRPWRIFHHRQAESNSGPMPRMGKVVWHFQLR